MKNDRLRSNKVRLISIIKQYTLKGTRLVVHQRQKTYLGLTMSVGAGVSRKKVGVPGTRVKL